MNGVKGRLRFSPLIWVAALLLALMLPAVARDAQFETIAFYTYLYVTMATAWNIIGGYAGYISLGHAAFFGLGAYTIALLAASLHLAGGYGLIAATLAGGLVAGLAAVPMGVVALRLRSMHSFVIVTIAYLFMFQLLAYNLIRTTGGSQGIGIPQPSWDPTFFNIPFYFAALLLGTLTILLSAWVRNSRFGLGLLAIRDDEDKAAGVGVETWTYKFTAYVLSAVPVGVAGALYACYASFIYPQTVFDPLIDLSIVLSAFFGGMGTLAGPVLGAVVLQPAQQLLTYYTGAAGWDLVLFGALFLAVILILPAGVVPTLRQRLEGSRLEGATGEVGQERLPVSRVAGGGEA